MPHSFQQRSPSPIPGEKQTLHEEELDEFGRVKQRRSHFGADGHTAQDDPLQRRGRPEQDTGVDNSDQDGDSVDERRDRRPHHRRRYHRSPSLSPSRYSDDNDHHRHSSSRYSSDEEEGYNSSDSHDRYRHHHHRRRRHSSASPRRYHDHRRHRRRSSEIDDRLRKKIYIGDLADISSSELEQVFSKFGRIAHIKLIEGKEYGFITFEEAASAQEAISMMNGAVVGSHRIKVNRAKMMDRSRQGNLTWMDEDGAKSYDTGASSSKIPPLDTLDPPIQRTLTSYDDLL